MGSATAEHDPNIGRAAYVGHVSHGGPQVNGVWRSSSDKISTVRDQNTTNIFYMFSLAEHLKTLSGVPEPSAAGGKGGEGSISPSPGSSNWWIVVKIILVIVLVCLVTVAVWSAWTFCEMMKAVL